MQRRGYLQWIDEFLFSRCSGTQWLNHKDRPNPDGLKPDLQILQDWQRGTLVQLRILTGVTLAIGVVVIITDSWRTLSAEPSCS